MCKDPITGKRVRKWVRGDTQKEVQEKLQALRQMRLDGTTVASSGFTVADLMRRWLRKKEQQVRPNTLASYRQKMDRHIIPHLGEIKLLDLHPLQIETMLDRLVALGHSGRQRQYVFSLLKQALKQAVKWRLINYNACDAVDTPTPNPPTRNTLTADQVRQYLAAIEGERNAALYILLTQTGLRISEALGLQWDCVDLRNGFITIRRSLVDADGEYYLQDATKTKSSCRRIKLSALAENALDDHGALMQSEGHKNAPWVFCSLDAGHLVRRTVLRDHKRILKSAGLPEITLHELRHTVGTLLAEWGHHPKTIADLLGHSTTQVTNDFYTHTSEGIHARAVEQLAEVISNKNESCGSNLDQAGGVHRQASQESESHKTGAGSEL